jgi:hypothetical protein
MGEPTTGSPFKDFLAILIKLLHIQMGVAVNQHDASEANDNHVFW